MKKILLFSALLVALLLPSFSLFAQDTFTATLNVEKIYVLYENGQEQVFELAGTQAVEIIVNAETSISISGTNSIILPTAEMNTDSRIDKIALWVSTFDVVIGGESYELDINGYYTCTWDGTGEPSQDDICGVSNISSWFSLSWSDSGAVTTPGTYNFNSDLTYYPEHSLGTLSHRNPFDAAGRIVNLKISSCYFLLGSQPETTPLN